MPSPNRTAPESTRDKLFKLTPPQLNPMRILVLILTLVCLGPAFAKTYRWVDENGKVHYGDRIPPQYIQQPTQRLNDRGIVVEERNRAKTAEEIEEERARQEAQAEAARQAAVQARYDQFLLSTYATQDQLILRRDEQLSILDSRIDSGQSSVSQSASALESLNARAEKFTSKDKPVPEKLAAQIKQFETSVKEGQSALNAMQKERDRVAEEFERDLNRYLQISR